MFKYLNIKKFAKGFTLIELLVSIMVFSLIVVTIGTIYMSAISWERRVVATEKIQENATLVIETMAREIRVSSIPGPDASGCTATTLTISHPIYGTVTYSLNSEGSVLRQTSSTVNVSSFNVKFSRMKFCIVGSGLYDNLPSKVTILLSLENRVGTQVVPIDIQTTITSRDIQSELED
ncbi:MAG: hypothetical protein A3B86_00075 [Candidatus Yanofskybacteria bacterium RIFCSPHIGHO2_02_FULL_38_22b]|uniref:Prepilin-type N-terminal cleavage/methylation domain-containing protein n=1 Tax=Candidatus Yanofskybacteria bacterium RIFCSPHIGHO2_02_FULL_38_22b TaxID=1802673 RepID=A0A1F8F1J4_9BACT|nr:MAG: hypothetical protein A2816_01015 [Candidatus Yanofskybacteria bacterium RIFCSPHIGHO2_01_FULL_39_44]OGN06993.1 MAG: hypothetical protein A3B86_00075 [Candidatus Yanofskybacteria bacterium RIFCSPHIGHO2_02_FULL_38_22b]